MEDPSEIQHFIKPKRQDYATVDVQLQRIKVFLLKLTKNIPSLGNFVSWINNYLNEEVNLTTMTQILIQININFKFLILGLLTYFGEDNDKINDKNIIDYINKLKVYFHPRSRINSFFEVITEIKKVDIKNVTVYNIDDILYPFRKSLEEAIAEICPDESVARIIELKEMYPKKCEKDD